MLDLFIKAYARLRDVWENMSLNQRVISGAVITALVGVVALLASLGTGTEQYTVLFGELDPTSASQVVARLEQQNVPYRLIRNGTAIEVPVNRADRLKIDLVAEGLPDQGIVGYEILDTTNFGMSDFLQKINYQRALTGELRKTLRTLDEIEDAQVHLHIPEPSLFTDEEQKPTASVALQLRGGRTIPPGMVTALTNLIGSAAGIDPLDVTILDTRGNLLTKPEMDETALLSSTQMEYKVKLDQYLTRKVKSMLDDAFGFGISLVTVDTEIDFDRMESTATVYDQDASAITSEEREEETQPAAEGGGYEHTITNYSNGVTVQNTARAPGSIKRMTVSVMIDNKDSTWVDDDGERQMEKVPWSGDEMAAIRAICENAVGYDPARGDEIDIVNLEFGTREPLFGDGNGIEMQAALIQGLQAMSTAVALIVVVVVFFFILRQITRSLDTSQIVLKTESLLEREKAELIVEEEEPESEKGQVIRKIITKAVENPEATAKALRTLYRE